MMWSGNFFQAVAQPHTPGLTQTLLSLLSIPLVLALTALCFGQTPSPLALLGASLIVVGSATSGLRGVVDPSGARAEPIAARGWAIVLFACAQLFMAGEKVFEEKTFRDSRHALRPMQMFFWTLATQFVLGWALYPSQQLPAFGGIDLQSLPSLLANGTVCAALGRDAADADAHTGGGWCTPAHAALFWGYCAVSALERAGRRHTALC